VPQGGSIADSTQNIQESKPSEPKDTLVATVRAIKALAVLMMDTGCGQMRDPPHGQKQRQQQAAQVRPVHNPTGFDIPAATFAILKRRFHAQAPRIELDLSTFWSPSSA